MSGMPDDRGMDDHAFVTLQDYLSPDELDRVSSGLAPYCAPDRLLWIFEQYRMNHFAQVTDTSSAATDQDVTAVEALTALRVLVDEVSGAFEWLMGDARTAGASWAQIGNALGMSKQAAWEKFEKYARTYRPAVWSSIGDEALSVLSERPHPAPPAVALGSVSSYFDASTLTELVTAMVDDPDEHDLDSLTAAFRAALNDKLAPTGITLEPSGQFVSTDPEHEDNDGVDGLIMNAFRAVDLATLLAK
jgi:hypothetical protein